jgi:hypothetical protein
MWPLSLLLFVATAAPQQQPLNVSQDFLPSRLPAVQLAQPDLTIIPKVIDDTRRNTCYTMRSYFFRRQDGQAPVPAGMTTCTPASVSQQRQVASPPTVKFVPLGATRNDDQ